MKTESDNKEKKNKNHIKRWAIIGAVILVLAIVVNIALLNYLSSLMDAYFGGDVQIKSGAGGNYETDADANTKETALAKANSLVEKICEEGTILLKNTDSALPLDPSCKVTVFGQNSIDLVYGSSGSVGGDTSTAPTIYDSLAEAGFTCNPVMKEAYEKSGFKRPGSPSMGFSGSVPTGFATGEAPADVYTDDVIASFGGYSDAAIVVISRTSGESYDLPMSMLETDGAFSGTDHYLELDKNEQEMLRIACDNFDKVILVLNCGTPIELGFLDDTDDNDDTVIDYDFADKIQAAVQIGLPGQQGVLALGRILNGSVNPSGHTTDTYARDFTTVPAAQNFSCVGVKDIDCYTVDGKVQTEYFMDYEEGIYVGYRYFETRGETDGDEWYQSQVVYPFGYGLSYTTFDQKIQETGIKDNADWKADTKDISVTVRVTNTGDMAGKDVVQLYLTAPYTEGGIEKAHKVLIGYEKTDIIEPGKYQDVTLSFDAYDLASYDYSDANGNGFSGYEIEEGQYTFSVGKNAHEAYDAVTTTLSAGITIDTDPATGVSILNHFDDIDDELDATQMLSRTDWEGTWPQMRTDAEKAVTADYVKNVIGSKESGNPLTAASDIVTANAAARPAASVKKPGEVQLYQLMGVSYDDPMWDTLISEMTANEMFDLIKNCAFKSPADEFIGKPLTIDLDGASGFTNSTVRKSDDVYDTCFYCSESILGATWNKQLAYEMGVSIGNEGLVGDERNTQNTYNGLYAPGVNLHRTPFGGRNPEYYSEDPVLSGGMATKFVEGASSKGVYCFLKHFIANDQETHRNGVCTWMTEQALRELYLKPFEIAVKEGGASALMTSFNRIGNRWAGGNYALLTEVVRGEWGFKGAVITDFASGQSQMDIKQMVYAGGDMWLDTITPNKWYDKADDLDVYQLQESTKHILYTVVNSNAMNGMGEETVTETHTAPWRIVLLAVDIAIAVLLVLWGILAFVKNKKQKAAVE